MKSEKQTNPYINPEKELKKIERKKTIDPKDIKTFDNAKYLRVSETLNQAFKVGRTVRTRRNHIRSGIIQLMDVEKFKTYRPEAFRLFKLAYVVTHELNMESIETLLIGGVARTMIMGNLHRDSSNLDILVPASQRLGAMNVLNSKFPIEERRREVPHINQFYIKSADCNVDEPYNWLNIITYEIDNSGKAFLDITESTQHEFTKIMLGDLNSSSEYIFDDDTYKVAPQEVIRDMLTLHALVNEEAGNDLKQFNQETL